MKERKIIFAGIIIMAIIALSCTKEKYPKEVHNIKATDCTYRITTPVKETDTIIKFTYTSNEVLDKEYKKMQYTGFCKIGDVEWNKSRGIEFVISRDRYKAEFLLLKRATITSGVVQYME